MEGCNEGRDGYRKRSLAINKENPPAGRLRTAGRIYFLKEIGNYDKNKNIHGKARRFSSMHRKKPKGCVGVA